MTTVLDLIKKRVPIQSSITRIEKEVNDNAVSPLSPIQVTLHLKKVSELEHKLENAQEEIIVRCKDDEIKVQEDAAEKLRVQLNNLAISLMTIQMSFPSASPRSSSSSSTSSAPPADEMKLPRPELPTFDGKFENWVTYRDLFTATIHNSTTLSGARKLYYLKTTLKGEAAGIIESVQLTDLNYMDAWNTIKNRYDNKREIVTSILNRIFSQPIVNQESASALQKLIDTTNECQRALKVLNRPVDDWDDVLVHLVVKRLDSESRRRWAMSLKGTDIPTFKELNEFMEQHIRGLMAGGEATAKSTQPNKHQIQHHERRLSHHGSSLTCPFCKKDHFIYKCEKFLAGSPSERNYMAYNHSLCYNCLKTGHSARECTSEFTCKTCNQYHNTLLHDDEKQQQKTTKQTLSATTGASNKTGNTDVLLATAVVLVKDISGAYQKCRILLDGGSQGTLISESCVSRLGLTRTKSNVIINGIGSSTAGTTRGQVQLLMSSRINKSSINVEALILPKVTSKLPNSYHAVKTWSHIKRLKLADPNFNQPGPIDILLGADYNAHVMRSGRREGRVNTPIAQETIFGWILSCKIATDAKTQFHVHLVNTDEIVERFWKIEEVPEIKQLTAEEKECEDHFTKTIQRKPDGRYIVSFPKNEKIQQLGQSRQNAISRLLQVEKRLSNQPEVKQQYVKFMKNFQESNFMESIPSNQLQLEIGPTVQDDLNTLLLRFRVHLIGVKADIESFYPQFEVSEEDKDFQRIVWRESPDQPIKDYRISRLLFGTGSAAYLATNGLMKVANDGKDLYPIGAAAAGNDFYVDDLISGASTREEALTLQQQLTALLKDAGMRICKWSSSDTKFLESIPEELRETKLPLTFDPDATVKALGVQWQPASDSFIFKVCVPQQQKITKRVILSELSKVFDPIGFLAPVTIKSKMVFQDLWKHKMDWDEELPPTLQQQWSDYVSQLESIQEISIPRCITTSTTINSELHGFCGASEKAFGGVIYMRNQQQDGSYNVQLLTSKTRIAPIKIVTLPRLELLGAQLLTKLIMTVKKSINFNGAVQAWTDSTTVLKWLAAHPSRWKTFVAHRVTEITDAIPSEHWHHVKGEENPADCISRGISADELKHFSLWWRGPEWLWTSELHLSCTIPGFDNNLVEAEAKVKSTFVSHFSIKHDSSEILNRFSRLSRLKRVTAWIFRFRNNSIKGKLKRTGELSSSELQSALHFWVQQVQSKEFHDDLAALKKSGNVSAKSKIKTLCPIIDSKGLLRVGGRLQNANIPEAQKHQLFLPHHHHLTTLIIRHHHLSNLHAGSQLLQATLQEEHWIVRARAAIRNVTSKCVICIRQKAAVATQLMGNLPAARVTPARPFIKCGLYYTGSFDIPVLKSRPAKTFKAYVCVFVCLTTKAIHLELVSDLTTEAFLEALKRFTARRGLSTDLYSDCGTNFVGAAKELKEFFSSSQHQNQIARSLAEQSINWHFNPPGAPHQGGLWEAGVKSIKYHLRRVLGSSSLNFGDFTTLLYQIEACLNSRPLCPMSSDPTDFTALTPGHFLIGSPLTAIPQPPLLDIKINRLDHWQHAQQLLQHFWKRWSKEYLSTLQQRSKWVAESPNVKINDLVLIKDENQPPTKWKMGRITDVHPGQDGLVRVVSIKTSTGDFKRPVAKIVNLIQDQI